ncbi:MAG TPA: hypothetical protein ENK07_04405 [Bacteroidetes bacterium]|nr:hypothetical protein [Bacteroidota bacterium]
MQPRYTIGGAQQVYNNFQGKNIFGDAYVHPLTGAVTPFMNTGDPLLHTGWLDDLFTRPCDVYAMQGSGPFDLAPGDTQRVVYAAVVAEDRTHLTSVERLKQEVNLVRDAFLSGFRVTLTPRLETTWLSSSEVELTVQAAVLGDVASVVAQLVRRDGSTVQSLELFDDGMHNDGAAGDRVYGNTWRTAPIEDALAADFLVTDTGGRTCAFRHAADKITLNRALSVEPVRVVDDNLNYDHHANPGENVRLVTGVRNGLSKSVGVLGLTAFSASSYGWVPVRHLFFPGASPGQETALDYDVADSTTFFEINLAPDAPDTAKVPLTLEIWDDLDHHWVYPAFLRVEPLRTRLEEITPRHTAGRSDAYFRVRLIDPASLTGHAYVLTVSDSIDAEGNKGFNLIDETEGDTLLANHPVPDRYAYNVPVTDGFKVVKAYLPKGGLKDVAFEEIEGGHPPAFAPVNVGGRYLSGGVLLGEAPRRDFCRVRLEFTNAIDVNGVVGAPQGQSAFRYEMGRAGGPTAFVPCPFKVWKIVPGQFARLLNVCFRENPHLPTFDGTWAPDTSRFGGFETLYIMSTDYDSSGQTYQDRALPKDEVLYEVHLRLASASSVVDPADILVFDWEYEATPEDRFEFVATGVERKEGEPVPREFTLYQNYPNPFNACTRIRFCLDRPGTARLWR